MVKHFNIIMAAVISGTVALFTSVLGVSGTIIGSVLSSFLYQLLSGYSEEKIEEGTLRRPRLANEIVYIFPLVVIGIFELIFFLSAIHYKFDMLFAILEAAVSNNLFRLMGISLILLGAYPFFDSNNIDRRNGTFVIFIGILLLLRGLVDITEFTAKIFYAGFYKLDFIFALFVIIGLALVILNILISSGNLRESTTNLVDTHKTKFTGAREIDTSFGNDGILEEEEFWGDDYDESNLNSNAPNLNSQNPPLPVYEEEIILVNNPDDPDNPIKKRILKRVSPDSVYDDYDETLIIDDTQEKF